MISLSSRRILLWFTILLTGYLVLPPIAIVLFSSVHSTDRLLPFESNFTIANIIKVFSDPVTYQLLLNTMWFTTGTVVMSVGLAILFAWFLERTNVPFRRLLFTLIMAPMSMPPIVTAMSWAMLANPTNGILNIVLRTIFGFDGTGPLNIYSIPGMIVVAGMGYVSVAYLMFSGVFARIDPSLEEAGRTSGAGTLRTFIRISMPLLGPAILGVVILLTVSSIETFEIPALFGRPARIHVFSTAIYYAVHPDFGVTKYGLASTYGLLLFAVAGSLIYFYGRYIRRAERFVSVTGRGYHPRLIDLGRWKFAPVLLMAGYFAFAVGFPVIVLIWTSLTPPYSQLSFSSLPSFSLNAYYKVLQSSSLLIAAKNTLLIGAVASAVGMLIATLISWLSVRGQMRGSWIPERLAFIVQGIPPMILALALMFIYVTVPIPLYATIWIIVLAFITGDLPAASRTMTAAFLQIHRELEEAAGTSGAGLLSTLAHILIPLLWPSFVRGFLFCFIRVLRQATIPLMLWSVGTQTLAASLWFLWVYEGFYNVAAAAGVILVIFTSILAYFVAKQTMLQGDGI